MNQKHNRIQVVYTREYKPYLYGAIHIVSGDVDNQWWERPFVISKRQADGKDIVYGTVSRTVGKIEVQMNRLRQFQIEAEARLAEADIVTSNTNPSTLPESEASDYIIGEQEELLEDVLLSVSLNVRILSEIFPKLFEKAKVSVYNYDNAFLQKIDLHRISDLFAHNRYIIVKGHYLVDLISDEKFLVDRPQLGLKINILEYLEEVEAVINSITVKDLITKLWGSIRALSAESSIKDIIFVIQNLYLLGELTLDADTDTTDGPLKTILDNVLERHIQQTGWLNRATAGDQFNARYSFTSPKLYLEPELEHKQIRMVTEVNGERESLVMGYEEMFRELLKVSGENKVARHAAI